MQGGQNLWRPSLLASFHGVGNRNRRLFRGLKRSDQRFSPGRFFDADGGVAAAAFSNVTDATVRDGSVPVPLSVRPRLEMQNMTSGRGFGGVCVRAGGCGGDRGRTTQWFWQRRVGVPPWYRGRRCGAPTFFTRVAATIETVDAGPQRPGNGPGAPP